MHLVKLAIIASFFWRLFPFIRGMDRENQIDPKRYSAVSGIMILACMLVFVGAILVVQPTSFADWSATILVAFQVATKMVALRHNRQTLIVRPLVTVLQHEPFTHQKKL